MRRLRKTCVAVLVWLTAASTLIANTPHFVCRCPNGQVKPFCLGSVSTESSCCCHGKCCSSSGSTEGGCCTAKAPPEKQEKHGSCCSRKSTRQNGPQPVISSPASDTSPKVVHRSGGKRVEGPTVDRPGCQRTLAEREVAPLSQPETNAKGSASHSLTLLAEAPPGDSIPVLTPVGQTAWAFYRLPPPTDLVTLLQRFTI
jgi:hypothetical protein